jgi:hypothetical protein
VAERGGRWAQEEGPARVRRQLLLRQGQPVLDVAAGVHAPTAIPAADPACILLCTS